MNRSVLGDHLKLLSLAYPLSISEDQRYLIVHNFKLPPGYERHYMDILLEIPEDYPLSPPGLGSSRIYVPSPLRYDGRPLSDVYEGVAPGWGDWAWFCYQWIQWDPNQDDLVNLLEMVRADLSQPTTK